ncbi:MAG: hypothetical protein ACP5RW_08235 [bacterium]
MEENIKETTLRRNKLVYEDSNKDIKDIKDIKEKKKKEQKNISSPSVEPEKGLIVYDNSDITPPDTIRSEVNFLVYPVFKLSKKKDDGRDIIEFRATIERENQRLEILWGVYPNQNFGTPGPFDKKVFEAIQEIIETLPRPVQNPISIGSLYSLCKRIGIDLHSGDNFKLIKNSLIKISVTPIRSVWTFYDKGRKRWIDDTFHLYDRVVFDGEELPDGTIADTNYVYLNSKYLDNINNGYVKPIDYNFYKGLKSNIAKRLYELLGVKFYPIFQRNIKVKFIRYLYDTLCDLIPLTKQKYLSKIQEKLGPALMELKEKQFIEKCEIRKESDKFYLYFYPGPMAIEEFNRFSKESSIESREIPLETQNSQIAPLQPRRKPEELVNYFYQKLTGGNLTPKPKELYQAETLLAKYDFEKASFIVDYAIESARKTNFDMKAFGAVLQYEAEAVESYEAMKKMKQKEEEDKRRKEEKERLKEEERLKAEEEARKIDEILNSLPKEELEKVLKEAEQRAEKRASIFIKSGKQVPALIVTLCIREIIRERYL